MKSQRRIIVVVAGMAAMVVAGVASVAWACTESASLQPLLPSIGNPGTKVRVVGDHFADTVELRWSSNEGPLLATLAGPSVATDVTIPSDAQPGVAYLVALSRNADGSIAGKASVPFKVAGGEAATSVWLDSKPAHRGSSPTGTVGIALLAVGVAALSAGSAVAVATRRRARAAASAAE